MDTQDYNEFSKKLSQYYVKVLPTLKTLEKERSALLSMNAKKAFKDRVKDCLIPEIKDIFGITDWETGSKLDTEYLLSLLQECNIEEFHDKDKYGTYLKGKLEERICGSYKGIKYIIWDMVDKLVFEFPSNKTIQNTTKIYTKDIINKKLMRMIFITLLSSAIFVLGVFFMVTSSGQLDPELIVKSFFYTVVYLLALFATILNYRTQKNVLEDPRFSKKYHVFSKDPVEARYLITTAFMERFKNLENKLDTKRIQCVFYQNRIIFAIKSKSNRFELADVHKKVDSPEQFKKFFEEFSAIIGMIDYFKLDEKTGL